jgi:hypothetical protein
MRDEIKNLRADYWHVLDECGGSKRVWHQPVICPVYICVYIPVYVPGLVPD